MGDSKPTLGISTPEEFLMLVYDYSNIPGSEFCAKYAKFDDSRNERRERLGLSKQEATYDTFIEVAEEVHAMLAERAKVSDHG